MLMRKLHCIFVDWKMVSSIDLMFSSNSGVGKLQNFKASKHQHNFWEIDTILKSEHDNFKFQFKQNTNVFLQKSFWLMLTKFVRKK